jgi:aspartyl-tRNA(Asn)/glutamyl-tRNA(Gln) amidotransferase subunit A
VSPVAFGKPLHFITVAEAARLIASRQLSPLELVAAVLDRISEIDPLISSFVALRAEAALEDARKAESEIARGEYRGALHGIPYGLKDNIAAKGMPLVANSRLRVGNVAAQDATVQRRLCESGAILLGKLNTYELGTGNGDNLFELPNRPARNPWDLARFSGGSSTGAGVAVAAGTALFAIGTDTGGSVRLPASACGAAGLKPTYGLISRKGMIANTYSVDYVGPIAWTAEDLGLVLPAIAGGDGGAGGAKIHDLRKAPLADNLAGLRVAVVPRFHKADVDADPEVGRGVRAVEQAMTALGAQITEVDFAYSLGLVRACGRVINAVESLAIHGGDYFAHYAEMGVAVRDKLAFGDAVSAADYVRAQAWRRQIAEAVGHVFESFDVILCCGATITAPRYEDRPLLGVFTTASAMSLFNLSGHPAVSICSGFSQNDGMPLGVQLVGRHFSDLSLLSFAAQVERMMGLKDRRPALETSEIPAPPSWARTPAPSAVPPPAARQKATAAVAETMRLFPQSFSQDAEPFLIPDIGGTR